MEAVLKMNKKYMLLLCSVGFLAGCHNGSNLTQVQTLQFDKVVSLNKKSNYIKQGALVAVNRLNDVASNGAVDVAVGNAGLILYSLDGSKWNNILVDIQEDLHAVTYNNVTGLFYAVGDGGLVISSPDGIVWNKYHQLQPVRNLLSVFVKNGDTIIGAESGSVYEMETSFVRSIVIPRNLEGCSDCNVQSITSNSSGVMVLATDKGDVFYKKYAQFKMDNWTKALRNVTLSFSDIYYDNTDGAFLVTSLDGYVMRSMDAIQWSTPVQAIHSDDKDFAIKSISVEPNSAKFLLVGGDYNNSLIGNSEDLNFWSASSYGNLGIFSKVKCFNQETGCFAVGENSVIMHSSYNNTNKLIYWNKVH